MKTILISLLVAIGFCAEAQFIQGPGKYNAVTNTGVWIIPSFPTGTATNIPTTTAKIIPIGLNGFGVFINAAGTNAITDTNNLITLELIPNGVDKATNSTIAITFAAGTTYLPFFTNIAPTTANLLNCAAVRIKSVNQSNIYSLYISNITIIAR